jgi:lipoate-protein ligase A
MRGRGSWFLWVDELPRRGWMNMAIDAALLELAERDDVGFVRLYRWGPPCLSFGRHEPAARRYRRERIEALGLDVVRRPTGGRAVWHEAELTYAVAAPADALGSLAESHREIHRMLARALERLGVEVTLAPAGRAAPPSAGPCFDVASGGELVVGGRKVVGSAQLRTATAFLQHGSILLDGTQQVLPAVSAVPTPPSGATSLSAALARPTGFQEVAEQIAEAARAWPGSWRTVATGDVIVERAAAGADLFRSDSWTWSR